MSKYFNKKTVYLDDKRGELKFDSVKEKNYYLELKKQEEEGLITGLELQKTFLLTPSISKKEIIDGNGNRLIQEAERKATYKPDFYFYHNGFKTYIAVDVKGFKEKTYIVKRKLFKFLYREIMFLEV